MATPPAASGPCHLLLADDAFAVADPEAAALLRVAARALGAHRDVQVFDGRPADFLEAYVTLQGLEIAGAHADFLNHTPAFGPTISPRFAGVRTLDPAAGTRWREWRATTARRLRSLLPPGTFLLMPTTPSIAPMRFLRGEAAGRFYDAALTLGSVAGHAGLPVVTLPIATLQGCPLGLSLLAGPGQDEALLAAAVKIA